MSVELRVMVETDKEQVIAMMRDFYNSPAVYTNGSEEIFISDVEHCVNDCPFFEGYVFEDAGKLVGYGMVAKSFSAEFGKPCIWLEDLYIMEEYRSMGLGSRYFQMIDEKYPDTVRRLEVEEENEGAVRLYKKLGYTVIPYMEMMKE